jgi:hypothetical protein
MRLDPYAVVMSLPVAPLTLSGEDLAELDRLAYCGIAAWRSVPGLACADSAEGILG